MINPGEMKLIQITITHKCPFNCCHCSQLVPHQKNPFTMKLKQVEKALQTLENYNGHIGLFGGEPLLHPQFEEICKLYQKYIPVKARRELWTMGANWGKYEKLIKETFYDELIAYNDHSEGQECWHQPLQIAIDEVFEDELLITNIIDNCWIQQRWSASITPMGAYFCEVAAARAHLFGKPKGLPVEKDWWKRPLEDYEYQIKESCYKCSACLPMPMVANDSQEWDDVSPGMAKRLALAGSPKYCQGRCKTFDVQKLKDYYKGHKFIPETDYRKRGGFKDFPGWTPYNYRNLEDKAHGPKETDNVQQDTL